MTGAVEGHIDHGPLRFPIVATAPEVVRELEPLGFVRHGHAALGGVDGAHGPSGGRGPTLHLGEVDGRYFTRVVEAVHAPTDDTTNSEPGDTATRYGAPVPAGGWYPTASAAAHSALSVMAERVVRAEGHVVHLHAGAVAIAGHAVVLPAASGAGKTTLTAALGARGAVLTDELVAVDRANGVLHAPQRPLSIKQSGFARARARYPHLAPPDPEEFVWHVTLGDLGIAHADPVPPGAIVVLDRRPGTVEIVPIDPGEALLAALESAYDLDVDATRAFDDLIWLVAASRCVRLAYAEADEAAAALVAWLGAPPSTPPPSTSPTTAPITTASFVRVDRPEDGVLGVRLGVGEVWWEPASRQITWVQPEP